MCRRKLTDEQVLEIQELLDGGEKTIREIANLFGVSPSAIGFICRRETYAHVDPEWEHVPRAKPLTERHRQWFYDSWMRGYSYVEISRFTGFSTPTISNHIKQMIEERKKLSCKS